jgi:hypothetical protein
VIEIDSHTNEITLRLNSRQGKSVLEKPSKFVVVLTDAEEEERDLLNETGEYEDELVSFFLFFFYNLRFLLFFFYKILFSLFLVQSGLEKSDECQASARQRS